MINPLINAEQLNKRLEDRNLIILDCSVRSNKAGLKTDYENLIIKGAKYFDLKNDFSQPESNFPNTLPTPDHFQKNCRQLGINNNSEIILYDDLGVYTSPRVWWMFKVMGHNNISVLIGGLPDWIRKNFTTETDYNSTAEIGNFEVNFQKEMLSDFQYLKDNLKKKEALVIDARSHNRYLGIDPEPRKGLRSGNIPDSINIPFKEVLDNGKFKKKDQLRLIFKGLENEPKKLIFSCGSGVTACIVYLASELVLNNKKSIYDGSWTEWGSLVEK